MTSQPLIQLVFPHQLFEEHFSADKTTVFIFIEDDLFFKQYRFHKQKLILHRASMRCLFDQLVAHGYSARYIENSEEPSMSQLKKELVKLDIGTVGYYDVVDDWLQKRLDTLFKDLAVVNERYASPSFLTSAGKIEDYFDHHPNRMQHFYEWQRRRLNILIDEKGNPTGGKWSYDEANRKKLPKKITLPKPYPKQSSEYIDAAITWTNKHFSENPGDADTFNYPITHDDAKKRLTIFLEDRFALFGPYEDAISKEDSEVFHSVLSPLLNNGLLTPEQVIRETLNYANKHTVPIESVEGFIRQIIGWREYMRATYVRFGRKMRTKNHLSATRSIGKNWWDGSTGLEPVDDVIKKVLTTAYAHHIERLMILGNSMVLLRLHPDEVYEWFMSLFIDAYDWVMVPNVYAMSQFAAADFITTKPYISGSNYIVKMSDYKKADWSEVWDALYWQFIDDFRDMIAANHRSSMMVSLYDRMSDEKKETIKSTSKKWLL
ncbi:MAG: cryptochrome/photolyase family protein [Candidatus Microsaccharimonas sp.]